VDGEYNVYRSLTLAGNESSYLYASKFLTSGDEPVDLTGYKTLKFTAKGDRDVTIKLLKNSISGIKHQYQTTISLTQQSTDYVISLNDFSSDSLAGPLNANDVNAILFAFDFWGEQTNFNFNVGSISFSPDVTPTIPISTGNFINVAPNPTTGSFTCSFYSSLHRDLELSVSDLNGKIFYQQAVHANIGRNTISADLPEGLPIPGVYMVSLDNKQVKYRGSLLSVIK
jgi:hypothetical protein